MERSITHFEQQDELTIAPQVSSTGRSRMPPHIVQERWSLRGTEGYCNWLVLAERKGVGAVLAMCCTSAVEDSPAGRPLGMYSFLFWPQPLATLPKCSHT